MSNIIIEFSDFFAMQRDFAEQLGDLRERISDERNRYNQMHAEKCGLESQVQRLQGDVKLLKDHLDRSAAQATKALPRGVENAAPL